MNAAVVLLVVLAAAVPRAVDGQAAAQFVPPELASNITSRLVFRQEGLAAFWKDPGTTSVVVRDRVVLDPDFWRTQFADTGGVAVLAPSNGLEFTITSEYPCLTNSCTPADNASQVTPELNFSLLANAMLVGTGGHLIFRDILLLDFAHVAMYEYTPAQPYSNQGVGWPLWPTIAMAPGARVELINVTAAYQNPAAVDTCQQYTERTVFALQQQYGNNVSAPNQTSILMKGPLNIPVVVYNGSTNATIGNASARIQNVTFNCVPRVAAPQSTAGGLAPGVLAVAIAVPIVVALAAAVGAWLCIRRRRQRKQGGSDGPKADIVMAVEMGHGAPDVPGGHWDQRMHNNGDKVPGLPSEYGYTQPPYHSSSSAAASSASVAPHMWSGSGMMPTYPATSGSTVTIPATPTALNMQPPNPLLAGMAGAGLQTAISQQYSSRQPSGSDGGASQGQRYSGSWHGHPSDAAPYQQTGGSGEDQRGSQGPSAGHSAGSQGVTSDGSRGIPMAGSGGSGPRGTGGSGDVASGSSGQVLGSGSFGRNSGSGGVPALLKARSDMAVLRDLKIGPLLGRGSYGRVYKGRWKAVTVAVKIIEHLEGSPGTASSGGKKISIGREAQLATSIAHPNVVQTYQISTMTVSQRNALARTWIEEGNANSNLNQLSPAAEAPENNDNDSGSSNDGNDEPQKDVLETWMIMEFCEKGSLDRAVTRKRFIRKEDGHPEMIGIYKALLDTASGLDYLHSIGVVHGDLKTANVLLKGSTRDVRGFACKITDFGLSRVLDLDATHISTRTYGTIVYMPSELLLTGRMTQSTDIYSFGLMMWELYTSSRIFNEGLSVGQIFYMIAYQGWRPEIPPGCPPGYAALMQGCWHQDPEQRPTAQEVLKALQKLYVQEKQAAAAAKQAVAAAKEAAASAAAGMPGVSVAAAHGSSSEEQQGSDNSARIGHPSGERGSAGSGGAMPGQQGTASSGSTAQRGSAADRDPASAGRPVGFAAGSGGPQSGSGGQTGGSGGSGPQEGAGLEQRESTQYQPWAQAISSRVGKQLEQDREDEQQPQPQHLTPRRFGWQPRTGPLQSVSEHTPVTAGMDAPSAIVGYGGGYRAPATQPYVIKPQPQQRYSALEIQPGEEDNGPPSESLYQNDSLISNIVPDDDAEDLDGPSRYDADAQIAAGYLDAVETAAHGGPGPTAAAAAQVPAVAYPQQTPFQGQQSLRGPLVPRHLPGQGGPSTETSRGLSGSSSTVGGGWGSVSTGTMPSAIGGNSSLNLSMMASQSMTSPYLGTAGTVGGGGSSTASSGPGQQQSPQATAARPPASPFAALAQRAGSLFGPLVKP